MTNITQNSKITNLQFVTILICFLMNMLDGMDVMVISYTAPAIAKEWAIEPAQLGIVFSAGLLGMAIGAMFLASKADIIGRRAMILLSAAIMGLCVWCTILAQNVETLLVIRFISGVGIGSMLASTATLASEYSPTKTKDFWVSFVMAGYPIGAVLSGLVAATVIPLYGWQSIFKMAGIISFITLPIVLLYLNESNEFSTKSTIKSKISVGNLLTEKYRKTTIWLWIGIFMAFASLYFLTTWIPKLASATGLSVELAIYAGTIFNLGAFCGIVSQGYFSNKFGLTKTIFVYLLITALLMLIFGFIKDSYMILILFGFIGFGIQGGFVGMYSLAARLYPTDIRATGVGGAVGIGRIGAIFGPLLGGMLIAAGFSMGTNFVVFSIPTIIAGLVTLLSNSKK